MKTIALFNCVYQNNRLKSGLWSSSMVAGASWGSLAMGGSLSLFGSLDREKWAGLQNRKDTIVQPAALHSQLESGRKEPEQEGKVLPARASPSQPCCAVCPASCLALGLFLFLLGQFKNAVIYSASRHC